MSDKQREQISALLDDELSSDQAAETLAGLREDEQLRSAWDRYHLIGDVMRGERVHVTTANVADKVRQRLESEPSIIAVPKSEQAAETGQRAPVRWLRPAAGAALAASVAVGAVMVSPHLTQISPESEGITVATAPAPISLPQHSGTRWKNLSQPEVESKLNRYLVDHSEYASPGGMTGVLPYASFVSYDAKP
ncbi:sigma-E factor negative regulatory protein [Solemya velesiana gill symbiont]|nr:sigma-E factor negative regulatory protein [Solemya velesiana gill symbiont]